MEDNNYKKSSGGLILLAYLMGMVTVIVAFMIITNVLELGTLITNKDLEYYHDLDTAYGKYYEIVKMIGEDPIATSTPEEITDADLKELVASIGDPYAQYFTPEEYEEFYNKFAGEYVGIGIGVVTEDDKIVIKTVYPDGPAEVAGIQPEDVIIRVNGTEPADIDEAISLISGKAGEQVDLVVRRNGSDIEFSMKKAKLDVDSLAYSVLDDYKDIGYIAITSFNQDTDEDFKDAVKDLEKQGCDKIIIDLRDNGGGIMETSIEIADYLLPACTIMTDTEKDGTETVYTSDQRAADVECVVLVNGNTASASEILSAAIQDNNGGKIIGTVTYGKGVTQITHRFKDGSAVKLTVSEYYRPNGDKVNGIGITPDIIAEGDEALDAAIDELKD